MKKLLSVSAAAVLIFTACQQPAAPHTHSYGDWETVKEPTCTEDGTEKGTCACGDKTTRTVDKKGHTDANGDYDCDDCGYDMFPEGWVEPTFVFDQSGTKFMPVKGTIKHPLRKYRVPFDGSKYVVAVPIIESKTGKMTFSDTSFEKKNVTADCDYFYFKDPEICYGEYNCYVIYDEIKAACDESHIKMDSERFKKLWNEFNDLYSQQYPSYSGE